MTMFDSTRYDIPALIEKLHDQRFDGYDAQSLATEVEKFRGGAGTASMGNAVEALKSVVTTLAATDAALRRQLSALGVTWQSRAGDAAGAVLTDQAGFAGQAYDNITKAAELIFEQGEAFTRTKNKLPDPEALRQGEGGFSFADTIFSLFGFETDHAGAVKANIEARAQAVDALNAYAHDSGDYLASSQAVPPPQTLDTTPPPGSLGVPGAGPGGTVPPPSIPDTSPTVAASAKDAFPPSPPPTNHVPPSVEAPTPAIGIPGGAAVSPVTTPQSSTPGCAPVETEPPCPPGTGVGGRTASGYPGTGRSWPGSGAATAPISPGQDTGWTAGGTPGPSPGGATAGTPGGPGRTPGANPGGAWGKPGGGALPGLPGDQSGEQALLGKGKIVGATTPPLSTPANVGPGSGMTRAPGGAGGVANGVTAIGAGAVGGATSGEPERGGRGFGRESAAGRGKPVRQMDIGDLPEEEEARQAQRAAPQPPSRARTRAILEPAATQDGDEDAEHVRRYGVDDKDLFTDPREVSPDLIGDRPLRDDR